MVISNAKFFAGNVTSFPIKEFYVKRLARIYPLYLLAILILLAFHFGIKKIDTDTVLYRMPFELTGVQRWFYGGSFNYPGWSISCEFMFYLLFPIIAVYLRGHRTRFTIFAWGYFFISLFISVSLSVYTKTGHSHLLLKLAGTLLLNPVLLISIFMLGVLAGKVFLENKIPILRHSWVNLSVVFFSIVIITVAKYYSPNGSGLLKGGMVAPVYFAFVIAVTSFNKADTTIFSNKLFIFLGEISYGVYIMQYPCYVFYTHFITPITTGTNLLLFILALVAVTSFLHLAFERPLRDGLIKVFTGNAHVTRV